ncbi:SusD/RagB family nutrient-binding outer membrane lipoprotein [Zunongwangia sp. HGR-M22]|uniref:SusD/RagB family nutrient-binding outer membrane lipoprotein n=1 Tax=Zunongwangia sp. HGR-M22 TaxID=3015168 RepID=UPI0022DDCD30|nr:SusD/RagB family nutrient-binding outer membrane lipoprotein [Zunongwangia sp. HGR-M22]WBL26180.1 SusD/RagB family nutrient-binding outer membrane lipoprotein [Zunongwangia sp. HGR-M22]
MKKYILSIFSLFVLFSCSDDKYERMNENPKNPADVPASFLFSSATKDLMDQVTNLSVNNNIFRFVSQYLTATTYTQEPNFNLTDRNIPETHFAILYRDVLVDLKDAEEITAANADLLPEEEVAARLAQIKVLQVYTWHYLVDTFGNVPFTEALDTENNLPVYDDALDIYNQLITDLTEINGDFNSAGFDSQDLLFDGDMSKWQKFSNSLLLRIAMRLSESNPDIANNAVQIAISNGVMESNDDSAIFNYLDSPPNTNPLWEDLVQSGRSDYVTANTIVDYMNNLEDPRRSVYFDDNLNGEYTGGIYGASNSYSNYTHIGSEFREPTHPGILMDYAEVEFLLTEAAARNIGGATDASSHYENAISASFQYWLGSTDGVEDYLSQSDVAYSNDNWEEKVATQFWIAMYDNAFQGWYVWRKFDNPSLNLPQVSENPIPLRFTYPIREQNLNSANYQQASDAIGGDELQTPLFWDVN